MTRFSLTGTRAFVTGANTRIGQAIALDLARHGSAVIAVGRSSMQETLDGIAAEGGQGVELRADHPAHHMLTLSAPFRPSISRV